MANRVCEAQQTRVQGLAGKSRDLSPSRTPTRDGSSSAGAVNPVADHRVSTIGKMYSDLMCSAGAKTAFDKCRLGAERAHDTIMCDCRPPLTLADDSHFSAICSAPTDVAGDLTSRREGQTPNQCGINAVDPTQGKVERQGVMGCIGLSNDHQSARVLVETMDDAGPTNPSNPREPRTTMADERVYESAVKISRSGVNDQARGLVDDDQMCVLKADIQRDPLRGWGRIFIIVKDYDENLAATDPQRRVEQRRPVACDMAGIDQPFDTSARQRWQMERKHPIKALADLSRAGKDACRDATRRVSFCSHDQTLLTHRSKGAFPG